MMETTDEKPVKTGCEVKALTERVEQLERQQKINRDAYAFAANEMRPLYGFGAIALIFDAIHKKLSD